MQSIQEIVKREVRDAQKGVFFSDTNTHRFEWAVGPNDNMAPHQKLSWPSTHRRRLDI